MLQRSARSEPASEIPLLDTSKPTVRIIHLARYPRSPALRNSLLAERSGSRFDPLNRKRSVDICGGSLCLRNRGTTRPWLSHDTGTAGTQEVVISSYGKRRRSFPNRSCRPTACAAVPQCDHFGLAQNITLRESIDISRRASVAKANRLNFAQTLPRRYARLTQARPEQSFA